MKTTSAEQGHAIKLWSPNWIALTTLLVSIPGGAPLALVNWWRMGDRRKFWIHLPLALVLTVYLIGLQPLLPELVRYTSDIAITLIATVYLWWQMRRDVAFIKAQRVQIRTEHWLWGIALSIASLLVAFGVIRALTTLFPVY